MAAVERKHATVCAEALRAAGAIVPAHSPYLWKNTRRRFKSARRLSLSQKALISRAFCIFRTGEFFKISVLHKGSFLPCSILVVASWVCGPSKGVRCSHLGGISAYIWRVLKDGCKKTSKGFLGETTKGLP